MTQKKDRRSARTKKRDESKLHEVLQWALLPKSPAFPRNFSSCAPAVPEKTQ